MANHVNLPYEKVKSSIDDIEDAIKKSKTIEVGVYQKKDTIGHTGLVLILDDIPRFTIDYGKPSNPSVSRTGKASTVGIQKYKYTEKSSWKSTFSTVGHTIGFSLLEIFGVQSLDDIRNLPKNLYQIVTNGPYPRDMILLKLIELDANKVIEFVRNCVMRTEKDYDFVKNNCRSFVEEVVEDMHHCEQIDSKKWEIFQNIMNKIKTADEKKFGIAGALVGGALGILTSTLLPASIIPKVAITLAGTVLGRYFELGKEAFLTWSDSLKDGWRSGATIGAGLGALSRTMFGLPVAAGLILTAVGGMYGRVQFKDLACWLNNKAIETTKRIQKKIENTLSDVASWFGDLFSWW